MKIEDIASELIVFKKQSEEYQAKRLEMYNKLTNSKLESFDYDGFRFSKTKEIETRNITKEKLWEALKKANISDELCSEIYNDSQNEKPRLSTLKMVELK